MPRDEKCSKFSDCLAGLGESEIDWHCDHCEPVNEDEAFVLRALKCPKVRDEICNIVAANLAGCAALRKAILEVIENDLTPSRLLHASFRKGS